MKRSLRPMSPARLASCPGPARLALALGAIALLSVTPSPAAAKAKPIVALAPVEVLLDGRRELVGVAVAPDGTVYVSDRKAGVVWRLAPGGWPSVAVGGLRRPAGLALDGAALLIAEQKTGRVLRLEAGALTVLAAGLTRPRWLAMAPDGSLYVTADRLRRLADRDEKKDRQKEDNEREEDDGEEAEDDGPRIIVRRDPGTGALSVVASGLRQLQGVAVNGHALDAALKRVVGLAPVDGAVARFPLLPGGALGAPSYLLSTGVKRPVGLALDRLGALYVTAHEVGARGHKAKDAVGKIHPDGHLTEFARALEDPQGAALGPDGSLYVADGGRLIRFRAPPAPAFTNLPEFTKQSPLTVTGTAQAHARVDVFVNDAATPTSATATAGGTFTVAAVALAPNAASTLEAFATAPGGLTSAPAEASVTHDDIPPALVFQAPPALAHVRQRVAIQAEATDDGSGIAQLDLGAGAAPLTATLTPSPPAPRLTASATWDTTRVGDGAVGLTATATDRAGNMATLSRSVIVDNTPPVITLTAGPAEGAVTLASVTFAFTVSDNLTDPSHLMVTLRLDDVLLAGATSPVTLPGRSAGLHTFAITAHDRAGNEATVTRGFTVSLGPAITNLDPPSGPAGTFVTITGASLVASPTQVTFNGVPAVVRSASPTSLTTTVPIGATTGPVTVTTSRGSASRPFTVTTTGDFTLTAAPTSVRAIAGDQTSVNLAAGGSGSFTSLVGLTVSTPPTGITASFSPSTFVAPGSSAFVNLVIANAVTPGSYNFTVSGQAQVDGRALTRTATFTLEVLAPGTTAITGRVLTAEAVPQPIPGVTVTLGSAFTLTDAGGNFVLLAPPPGANMLLVDGRTASTPTVQYPPVEVNIAVNASGPTRVPFIVYLPKLDTANPVTLPLDTFGFTTQEVRASTPSIPGLVVTIPAGTKIVGPDGNPVSQITITPVPVDRSPMPFPPGVTAPMLFTIQPGGAVPSQPLPISFPNVTEAAPGTKADLWFFDLAAGNWKTWGTGTVSADGTQVVSDPGFGLPRFAWHFWDIVRAGLKKLWKLVFGGDPVDLATGAFTVDKTDLVLPGRLPVSLQRSYRSDDTRPGLFGIGWNLALYDSRLTSDGATLTLITADQNTFQLRPSGPGQWTSSESVLLGAVVTQLPGEFNFQIRYKDRTVHRYDRIAGFANTAGLAAITDRTGNTVTITRAPPAPFSFGLVTRITEPGGRSFDLQYDLGRITRVTDPLGRTVQYTYDARGRLATVTDAAGGVTRYTYDAQHRMVSITDPRNITFLTNEYDAQGRVIRQTQADGGVWQFTYTLEGDTVTETRVTDPRGNTTLHRFNGQGFPLAATDALGQTPTFEYAQGTNLLVATTDPLGRTTRFTYDALGNVTGTTDPAGHPRTFTYEPAFNKVASITDPLGQVTQFGYDAQGNLTSMTDPLGKVTTLTYNALGQPLTTTDPLGNTTTFSYDGQGNLASTADPLGNTTGFQYDAVSRLVRQTDPRGKPTAFVYDPLNQVASITDALGGVTRFTFDANGNLLTVTDARGNAITHTYDAMDRLATRTDQVGARESFVYDPASNLTQRTDRKGQVSTFVYDALNRLTGTSYADGSSTSFAYDAAGRLVRVDDPVGGTLSNSYDVLDRLLAQSTGLGTVSYQYDALGRRTGMDVPGTAPVAYAYDAAGRLSEILQGTQAVSLQYDAAGRRTRLALPNGVSTEYQYDVAARLTALIYRNAAGVLGTLTYQYDAAGNRTQVGGSFARTLLPNPVASATYDPANRQLTFGDKQMTFDANGNLAAIIEPSGTTGFTWDARDRLVGVETPGILASFGYAFGRRLAKTVNGATTQFLYDGLDIAQQLEPEETTSYFRSLAIDEAFGLATRDGTFFSISEALGSTLAVTDTAGNPVNAYSYDPFGDTAATNPGFANPFQFTGRENDGLAGIYYYRARFYSTPLHRFLSEDSLGVSAGVNLYYYGNNNPLRFNDPTGLATAAAGGTLQGGFLARVGFLLQGAIGIDTEGNVGVYVTKLPSGMTGFQGVTTCIVCGTGGGFLQVSPNAGTLSDLGGAFDTTTVAIGKFVQGTVEVDRSPTADALSLGAALSLGYPALPISWTQVRTDTVVDIQFNVFDQLARARARLFGGFDRLTLAGTFALTGRK